MSVKRISILGSTGSIGTQALDVVRKLNIKVNSLAAHSNIKLLEDQIREFKPKVVALFDSDSALKLKKNISDLDVDVLDGIDGICELAAMEDTDIVLNSIVGIIGLKPTLEAIKAKNNVAIANKETLVAGGALVMKAAKENGLKIIPVDSEHSAIFQCLQGCNEKSEIKKLILTASGGPFFGKNLDELKNVSPEEALKHPNWDMGAKVTVDSASMMNKGLEIIEAVWLFDIDVDNIDVVVHRESIIHSMVEYNDNSIIAQMGVPDMRIPIQYALTWPQRRSSPVKQLNLTDVSRLTFFKPDYNTFKCLDTCKKAIKIGGLAPAAANGANEEAVKLFLNKKISFTDIGELVYQAMVNQEYTEHFSFDDVIDATNNARNFVLDQV